MPRLFVAIDLPDERTEALRGLREDELDARWSPPDQLHLTLRFLGDVDEDRTEELKTALTRVDMPSFLLAGQGMGVFPSIRKPRVLIVRIEEALSLMALQASVENLVLELGFPEERKPFNPHVTIARFKKAAPREVRQYLKRHSDVAIAPFTVGSFRLYESRLGPEGAVHSVLEEYPLRSPSPG